MKSQNESVLYSISSQHINELALMSNAYLYINVSRRSLKMIQIIIPNYVKIFERTQQKYATQTIKKAV